MSFLKCFQIQRFQIQRFNSFSRKLVNGLHKYKWISKINKKEMVNQVKPIFRIIFKLNLYYRFWTYTIGSTHCCLVLNQLFTTEQRKCKISVKGWHFHVIGFYAQFLLTSHKNPSIPPYSTLLQISVFCYLLPSFVPFNLNCPSRKHNFHLKGFMIPFQAAVRFLFSFKQLIQNFEIQDMEEELMSCFENVLLPVFQHFFFL